MLTVGRGSEVLQYRYYTDFCICRKLNIESRSWQAYVYIAARLCWSTVSEWHSRPQSTWSRGKAAISDRPPYAAPPPPPPPRLD